MVLSPWFIMMMMMMVNGDDDDNDDVNDNKWLWACGDDLLGIEASQDTIFARRTVYWSCMTSRRRLRFTTSVIG